MFADKKEFIEKQAREQVRYIAAFLWEVFLPGDWRGGGSSCTFLTAVMLMTVKTRCVIPYTQESFINSTEYYSSWSWL